RFAPYGCFKVAFAVARAGLIPHAHVEEHVDVVDVALSLEDIAPGVPELDAQPGVENAAIAGELQIGMRGGEDAADDVGAVADFAELGLGRAVAAAAVDADAPVAAAA